MLLYLYHIVVDMCTFVDPYEDQFEKHSEARKEKIAKNEYQRLKNIAKNTKGKRVKGLKIKEIPFHS